MATTHFRNGVSNQAPGNPLFEYPYLDPFKYYSYVNDFFTYTAGDWTITTTEAGSGAATEALTSVAGGALLVTNDDADNDADFFNLKGESFAYSSTKNMFFKARFKVSDATQSDIVMGLQITDTTPLAVSDGIYFMKDLLLYIFTKLVVSVRSKTILSLSFTIAAAFLSAFLDALTVMAVVIAVAMGFYSIKSSRA